MNYDLETFELIGGVILLLAFASAIGAILKVRFKDAATLKVIANLNDRIRAWWIMVGVFGFGLMLGPTGTVILFTFMSFLALREYITLIPSKRADHRALFWGFFIVTPIQYMLVANHWYGLFSIFIPVYVYMLIPIRNVIAGDWQHFLERTARIQWGLMVCVYFVSYAPALLTLKLQNYEGQNAKLLFFFVCVVQMSDVFQYVWGKLCGRHKIAPNISPNKTVEGLFGGILSASFLGMALWWATPFTPWQAFGMSLIITIMGFFGGLTMSAIKRDRGVKDYGNFIAGHGGMLDRIDSLCFAAPVFFHLTRYFFTQS